MATDYNSQLIVRLYAGGDLDHFSEVIKEMGEIADPVFVGPLLANHKKNPDSSVGHYFVNALENIQSSTAVEALKEMLALAEPGDLVSRYAIPAFTNKNNFDEEIVNHAKTCLKTYFSKKAEGEVIFNEFALGDYLNYYVKSGKAEAISLTLADSFFSKDFSVSEKSVILKYLFKINASEAISTLMGKADEVCADEAVQILLAKEVINWKDGNTPDLVELIRRGGSKRAAEILDAEIKKQQKQQQKIAEQEQITHSNFTVVKEIVDLRRKINDRTEASFGVRIFLENELLLNQTEVVTDEPSFKSALTNLRSVLHSIAILSINLKDEDVTKIIGDSSPAVVNHPLNQLHLFLVSKGLKVDTKLFGFRRLQRVAGLHGSHPEKGAEAIILLKGLDPELYKLFSENRFKELHKKLLEILREGYVEFSALLSDSGL